MSPMTRMRWPSKRATFGLLMAVSLVLMLLPNDLLRPLRNVTQCLAPLQLGMLEASRAVAGPVRELAETDIEPAAHDALLLEREALANENAALRQQMIHLQARIDELSGIRGSGVPAEVRLIAARVIGRDAAAARESMTVGKGSVQAVGRNDWVVTRLELDAGADDGVQAPSAVLARQCLIGWVDQAAPLTSRVVLLSDRVAGRHTPVHIASAKTADGKRRLLTRKGAPLTFILAGAGGGRMKVLDVPARLVDAGFVQPGDLVTSDPNDPRLPQALVIGEVESLQLNPDTRVHYDAIVRYPHDPADLTHVFIADIASER